MTKSALPKSFKVSANAYDTVNWYLRIFAASLGEILAFYLLVGFIQQNSETVLTPNGPVEAYLTIPLFYWFLIYGAFIFVAPLLLSLILTKKDVDLENLRIVPPLYVSIIGVLYAAVFFLLVPLLRIVGQPQFANIGILDLASLMFLIFIPMTARAEDSLAIAILGRTADRQAIFFEKLRVHASIEEVKAKLSTQEYADNLSLRMNVAGTKEEGYVLKTQRGFAFTTKVGLYVDEDDKNRTILKVAFYEKSPYSLRLTKYFIEHAREHVAYLHDLLTGREPLMKVDVLVALTNNVHDLFINDVLDDLRGFYVQTKRAPRVSILLVGTVVALTGLTIGFFLSGYPEEAFLATGAIDIVILIVTVMEYIRKGR